MFCLILNDVYYYLNPNEIYTVGRVGCDIPIKDVNINRKHAILRTSEYSIEVQDCNSASGTRVDGVPVIYVPHNIFQETSEIILGNSVILKIQRFDFNVTSCGIDDKEKKEIRDNLITLHGRYYDKQNKECKILVSNKVSLDVEYIQALACGLHIVTVDFIKAAANAVKECTPLPEFDKYFPKKIISRNINAKLFEANENRKLLFANKVFFGEIPKEVQDIIQAQGGEVTTIYDIEKISNNSTKFFVKYPTCCSSLYGGDFIEVREEEIFLATLHVDCDYLQMNNRSKQIRTNSVDNSNRMVVIDSEDEPSAKRVRRNSCSNKQPDISCTNNETVTLENEENGYSYNQTPKKISIEDMEIIKWVRSNPESTEEEDDDD